MKIVRVAREQWRPREEWMVGKKDQERRYMKRNQQPGRERNGGQSRASRCTQAVAYGMAYKGVPRKDEEDEEQKRDGVGWYMGERGLREGKERNRDAGMKGMTSGGGVPASLQTNTDKSLA